MEERGVASKGLSLEEDKDLFNILIHTLDNNAHSVVWYETLSFEAQEGPQGHLSKHSASMEMSANDI